jgi:hypothetical protein
LARRPRASRSCVGVTAKTSRKKRMFWRFGVIAGQDGRQ